MIFITKPGNRTHNIGVMVFSMVVRQFFQNVSPDSYENCHPKLEKYCRRIATKKRKKEMQTISRKCNKNSKAEDKN